MDAEIDVVENRVEADAADRGVGDAGCYEEVRVGAEVGAFGSEDGVEGEAGERVEDLDSWGGEAGIADVEAWGGRGGIGLLGWDELWDELWLWSRLG